MFATPKELFEQWILSMGKCLEELDSKLILVPKVSSLKN